VDRDPEAIAAAATRLAAYVESGRFRSIAANYAELDDVGVLDGVTFDGILLDLGVSSRQFDAHERGFTFREGAPLDMRMAGEDGSGGETAAELLNRADERELATIFKEYGDEHRAPRLAREIVRRRATEPFVTSDELVRAIRGALGPRTGAPDFARLFQALRIAVNDELGGLRRALPALRARLDPGGVFAIITYHSGEDRIVKNSFRGWSTGCICPPKQPVCTCGHVPEGKTLTKRPILPSDEEIQRNPRARSAKLRAWRTA
jgi:16S rRNA (cytosine1402-N4)-methyltransferase